MVSHLAGPHDRLSAALVGRYRLERELGAGGMATVYLAEDVKHRRQVAIKVLHAELSAILGPERFLKEIELTANLQHPHILPLFDSGNADGLLYYVMPYVEGETLRGRLERERQLPIADSIRVASEVADALDYAHGRGIVHRDIKPENILLQNGHALVADFGIALAVQQAGGTRMTQTGLSLGTPQYMSPEQAMGEREIGPRSDIYALGAVTYEMLAGEPPFTGPTAQAIVARVMTDRPRPLTEIRETVLPQLAGAVMTALAKLPADRFTRAADFATALSAPQLPGALASAGASSGVGAVRERQVIAALSGLAVVLAAAAAWGWVRAAHDAGLVQSSGGGAAQQWRVVLSASDSAPAPFSIALSPDGAMLAYVRIGRQNQQLWLRRANSLIAAPIAGTAGGGAPAFSPDGRRLSFMTSDGSVHVIPLDGASPTTVTRTKWFSSSAWSDDDHLIVATDSGLMLLPVRDGKSQRLTTVDTAAGEGFHAFPSMLPDGKAVVFTVLPRPGADSAHPRIAVSDLRTGRHTILMPGFEARYVSPGFLLVETLDSSLVAVPFDAVHRRIAGASIAIASGLSSGAAFTAARDGRLVYLAGTTPPRSVARVRRDGSATLIDSTWTGYFRHIAASSDGAMVAVQAPGAIQVRDLRSGALSSFAIPLALYARAPVFTSDGRAVAFGVTGFHDYSIDEAILGSSAPPQRLLHSTAAFVLDPAFSPDGRTLFYARLKAGSIGIFAHSVGDAVTPDRRIVAPAAVAEPRPSPDGRWLAYVSEPSPAGHSDVYVRPIDPSRAERWQISHGGGEDPHWSRDGRELFYVSSDSMIAVQLSRGAQFAVASQHALFPASAIWNDAYDVLPGNAGFVALTARAAQRGAVQMVMLDNWQAALADSARSHE